MTKVVSLGGIEFDYPLFIKDDFAMKKSRAEAFNTIGGSKVVFESVKRNNANYITLISKDSGWIKEETLKSITLLLDDLDVAVDLVAKDGTITKVRPALELGDVIKADDAVNELGKWLKVEILLCEV